MTALRNTSKSMTIRKLRIGPSSVFRPHLTDLVVRKAHGLVLAQTRPLADLIEHPVDVNTELLLGAPRSPTLKTVG